MSDSCGCIAVWVDDPIEELREEIVQCTLEEVKCGECGVQIEPGEEYEDFIGDNDGTVFKFQTCSICLAIRNEFFCGGWHYGTILDRVQEHVDEMGGEISSECLLRLPLQAREIIIDYIDDVFEDMDEEG